MIIIPNELWLKYGMMLTKKIIPVSFPGVAKTQPILRRENGRLLRKNPRNDILCIVIASEAKQSFSHKQTVLADKG